MAFLKLIELGQLYRTHMCQSVAESSQRLQIAMHTKLLCSGKLKIYQQSTVLQNTPSLTKLDLPNYKMTFEFE